MKTLLIQARCPEDLKKRVEAFAQGFKTDESTIVRQAIEEYLERHATAQSIQLKPEPPKILTRTTSGALHQASQSAAIVRRPKP